jgi:hypothetical protein
MEAIAHDYFMEEVSIKSSPYTSLIIYNYKWQVL